MTPAQDKVMRALMQGCALHVEKTDEGERFFLSDSTTVFPQTVDALERLGKIRRLDDGLWGDGQSFEVLS